MVVLREMQEREKALRLQKERLQRELEEKRRKVGVLGKWAPCGLCAELRALGNLGYTLQAALPCHMGVAVWQEERKDTPNLVAGCVLGRTTAPG